MTWRQSSDFKWWNTVSDRKYILRCVCFRQISGAMIRISNCEDRDAPANLDRTITISGNCESVALAQYLINMRSVTTTTNNSIKHQLFILSVFMSLPCRPRSFTLDLFDVYFKLLYLHTLVRNRNCAVQLFTFKVLLILRCSWNQPHPVTVTLT